jgi:hypothetical protein
MRPDGIGLALLAGDGEQVVSDAATLAEASNALMRPRRLFSAEAES